MLSAATLVIDKKPESVILAFDNQTQNGATRWSLARLANLQLHSACGGKSNAAREYHDG